MPKRTLAQKVKKKSGSSRVKKSRSFLGRRENRIKHLHRLALVLIILTIIGCGIWSWRWWLTDDRFIITDTEVLGNERVDTEAIVAVVNSNLQSDRWVTPAEHVSLFNQAKINRDLLAQLPNLATTQVQQKNQTITVTVTERQPDALWCRTDKQVPSLTIEQAGADQADVDSEKNEELEPKNKAETDCWYIDENAFAYEPAPTGLRSIYSVFFHQDTVPQLQSKLVPFDRYQAVKDFSDGLQSVLETKTTEVTLNNDGDVTYQTLPNFRVLTTVDRMTSAVLDDLLVVMQEVPMVFNRAQRSNLEYIDLRFKNKVLYKQFNSEVDLDTQLSN